MSKFNVTKRRGKAKIKIADKRKAAMNKIIDSFSEDLDIKMRVIQELIPLGLREICKELQQEVTKLAGDGHARGYENTRWGRQPGSVYVMDQKFPIIVPRVRNKAAKREVQLQSYQKVQSPFADDGKTALKLLHGISMHKYHESSSLAAEAIGLSASNLSKRFKNKSTETLRQLQERRLDEFDIIALFIDAKRYADDGLIVGMGVTMTGDKIVLGIEHIHSENALAIEQWIQKLIERGLKFDQGILVIIDGSKGIAKAVRNCFGKHAIIQRCQWHKRENVVSYLNDDQKTLCRGRMKTAYGKTTHKEAKAELEKLYKELVPISEPAANSLLEGLEETLTLHRLGLSSEISRSFNTTNCIESFMSLLGPYTDKVDRWQNSNQILRWTAAGAMDIEPRLYKIKGYNYLKVLRLKIQQMIKARELEVAKDSVSEIPDVSQAVLV
jgi:transposase-like protein